MKKFLLLFMLLISAFYKVDAQVGQLLGWQFSNPNFNDNFATVHTAASFWTHPGVESSTLSRGPGLSHSSAGLTRAFTSVANNWVTTTGSVRSVDDYFQVTVQAKAGFTVSLKAIDFKVRRSAAGGNTIRWAYSINGGGFNDIGATDISYTTVEGDGLLQPVVDLSGISNLQNLTSSSLVTFRMYAWGYSTAGGSFAFGRNADGTNINPSLAIRGDVVQPNISTLLGWDLNIANGGNATIGSEASLASTNANANINTSTLTRNGLTAATLTRAISTTGTVGNVKRDGDYFEFDVTPNNPAKFISLNTLDIRLRRTGGGATTYSWSYSKDGGAFINIGTDVTFLASDDGIVQPTIDLSAISALQNITNGNSIRFRLHAWNFTTAAGTFAIGRAYLDQTQNSIELRGQVTDQPLPVKLTSFTAKANKSGSVNLAWSTASEKDNSHFEVTRATDGLNFNKLAEVKGNGNSDELKNYSYTDTKPVVGINYYRLRQVDNNGESALSTIAIAKVGLGNDNLTVAVAGNRSSVAVTYNAPINGKALFNIYNVSGIKVASVEQTVNTGLNQINIPVNLGNSLHVLNVSQAGSTASTKF